LKPPPKPADPAAKTVFQVSNPSDIEFSPDGRYLLVFDPAVLSLFSATWENSPNRVVAVDGSGDMPVDKDNRAFWAAWSPSGTALAYIVRAVKQPDKSGLYMVQQPGEQGKQVYAASDL